VGTKKFKEGQLPTYFFTFYAYTKTNITVYCDLVFSKSSWLQLIEKRSQMKLSALMIGNY